MRCPKFSHAWNVQCELDKGHKGQCVNKGDGFHGYDPNEQPKEEEKEKK